MADQLLSTAAGASLPASYIRPESQRPRLHEVMSGATIPTVDLGSPDNPQIVTQVAAACQAYGFSQAAMEIESRSLPAGPSVAEAKPTSLTELVSPAALCVAIYGSIPQDVQLHHRGNALYNPLMAFIFLGVLASLYNVIYALVRPDTCGGGDSENVKRRVTGVAVAFFLVAFVLRVLLVH